MRALYDRKHTNDAVDRRVAAVAAAQHGVFTRAQAVGCGATDGMLKWRRETGRWERLYPMVYRLAGAPTTWRQLALAACLHFGADAAVSHRAAVALRTPSRSTQPQLEVTVARNRNRHLHLRYPIVIHWVSRPAPEEVTTIGGIPVTKPARTLLDLAATEPRDAVEGHLDDALRRKLVTLAFLQSWLNDPRRHTHRGTALLRRLVEDRAMAGVTESPLESQLLKLIRSSGLPAPITQYVVEAGNRFVARMDFAYPERRVAIEADGFRHHDERATFDRERARGNELEALGWRVLRVTARHLEDDPTGVVDWIRRVLRS